MATSSAVSNLERRLDVLEEQAAENQYNLVRNKLRMWKGCCFVRPWTEKTFRPYITIGNSNRHATRQFTEEKHLTQTFSIPSTKEKRQMENVTPPFQNTALSNSLLAPRYKSLIQLLKGFLCGSAFKMPWQPTMLINFELTSLERDH